MFIGKLGPKYKPRRNDKILFIRDNYIQTEYDNHRINILKKYSNITNYILKNVIKDNLFKFTINLFPYNLRNIKHYLLWINPKYEKYISDYTIYTYLNLTLPNSYFDYFINSTKIQSIRQITHYHVFIYDPTFVCSRNFQLY